MSEASIKKVFNLIEKEHNLIIKSLGDAEWPKVERIPSGSLSLDLAIGGGWPRGRVVEIAGLESSGKTLITLHAIAQAQRLGGRCVFFDAEYSFDAQHASNQGVDVNKLDFVQPEYGEQALEAVMKLCEANEHDIIVVDSVPSLIPKAMMEGALEDHHMALLARMMSNFMQKVTSKVGTSKTVLIFINQLRKSLNPYGNPYVLPGGMALNFYAHIIINAKKESKSERRDPTTDYVIGHDMHVKITKNKTAPPLREATVPFNYASGILLDRDFLNAAKSKGLVVETGKDKKFKYNGTSVENLKGATWSNEAEVLAWLVDQSSVENVLSLRQEIVGC